MLEVFTPAGFTALLQVVGIDLALAGDNAIVIGLAAAGLPKEQRARAIFLGIIAATIMRIAFAAVTTQLLEIVGLLLAGGILLLWVCWKMWRELRTAHSDELAAQEALSGEDLDADGQIAAGAPRGLEEGLQCPPGESILVATPHKGSKIPGIAHMRDGAMKNASPGPRDSA